MTAPMVTPAELVAECLTGGVRKLLGGVHSLTSSRVVVACTDPTCVRVKFSTEPGRLAAPWEPDTEPGWWRAPRDAEPGLRDSSADPVLVVVGVAERQIVAVNALAIDEIGVTCRDRDSLIDNWLLQAQVQGAEGDAACIAGVRLSDSADATIVVADPLVDGAAPGWVDVLAVGTSWPVRPLRVPAATPTLDEDHQEREDREDQWAGAERVDGEDDGGTEDEAIADDDAFDEQADDDTTPVTAGPGLGTVSMTLFGGLEVIDAHGVALQPKQQQIVAAIALLQPISTGQLCQSLYGIERHPSIHVSMAKIRRRGVQPVWADEAYTIDIASDWRLFVELVGDPTTTSTEQLMEAAALITGGLFGDDPPPWAAPLLPAMTELVCAVCRELAARHVEQPKTALFYAHKGLQVDPHNTELTEIATMLTEGAFPNDMPGGDGS